VTSFSCRFPAMYKEALEVGSYHTAMCGRVGIGDSSFCLHCALKVRSLLQSLNLTKTFGGLAYLTYLIGKR